MIIFHVAFWPANCLIEGLEAYMKKLSLIVIGIMSLSHSAFAEKLNAVECSKLSDMIEMYSEARSGIKATNMAAQMPSKQQATYSHFSDEELKAHGVTDEDLAELKAKYSPKQVQAPSMSAAEIALKKAENELREEQNKKWELEDAAREKMWQEEEKKREAKLKKQKADLQKSFNGSNCAEHFKNLNSLPVMQEIRAERLKWQQEE